MISFLMISFLFLEGEGGCEKASMMTRKWRHDKVMSLFSCMITWWMRVTGGVLEPGAIFESRQLHGAVISNRVLTLSTEFLRIFLFFCCIFKYLEVQFHLSSTYFDSINKQVWCIQSILPYLVVDLGYRELLIERVFVQQSKLKMGKFLAYQKKLVFLL